MTDMTFALLERRDLDGPLLVHEIFPADPKLHPSLVVIDVSDVPGLVVGWERREDGTFGPYAPPLDDLKADRRRALRFDCLHTILGGFASSALGAPHRYGSSDTDQTNIGRALRASLTRSKDPAWTARVPCRAEGEDEDVFRPHNAAQIHTLECDLHDWIEAARLKRDDFNRRIATAETADAVQAVTWA